MHNQEPQTVSRRRWLNTAAGAMAAPYFVPTSVLGALSPNDTMRIGCIGTGRMGHGDMKACMDQGQSTNAKVVAVCDLNLHRAQHAKDVVEKYYSKKFDQPHRCDVFADFRELLAREDIDGVTISTPDHWHAICAVAAATAGKDIYLQKPLTYSIAEGRTLVRAVRQNSRVFQTGSQQRSEANFRQACELARNGRIGTLKAIRVNLPSDHGTGDPTPSPVPPHLNYEMWLGPTPDAPYTEDRVHPQNGFSRPGWLQIERYCRGMITGWGAHMNDTAQWANGTDDTGPIEVEASAEFPDRGLFDVHTKFQATLTYANGVKLFMQTGDPGVRLEGDDGWIHVRRGGIDTSSASILSEELGPNDIHLARSDNHMRNFLECMRSRKDPVACVETGHRSNSVCVLAHIAMKLGRTLRWNPKAERFVNDSEADGLLDYPHRSPWQIASISG